MPDGLPMLGSVKVDTTPAGVIRPIESSLVNQRFPSGPAAIAPGELIPVWGKLVTVPIGVGHEVNTNADDTMTSALTANHRNCAHVLLLDIRKLLSMSAKSLYNARPNNEPHAPA